MREERERDRVREAKERVGPHGLESRTYGRLPEDELKNTGTDQWRW